MNKKILVLSGAVVLGAGLCAALLLYFGVIHLNHPKLQGYTVKGVDVSSYQGDINWQELASQDIDFAYIKATEGSSYVDEHFEENWAEATDTDLRIGAYHFFSFESPGVTQAENFCDAVEAVDGMLPPVIDVEYYGAFGSVDTIDVDAVRTELRDMVDILTEYYGMKPVIYVSADTYDTIVKSYFDDCDLWYRSVYSSVPSDADWAFWQYSNRHVLRGYDGEERYIDMDVFAGDPEEFASYI